MMGKKIIIIGLLSYGIIAFLGCASTGGFKDKGPTGESLIEPQTATKFLDIPVPRGFKLLDKDSYAFETAGIRVAVLKYQGKAKIEHLISFYKEQMQACNWELLNIVEYGERILNFDRETETCIINISPKGSSLTITISLGPKAQKLPKKSDKPVK